MDNVRGCMRERVVSEKQAFTIVYDRNASKIL